MVIPLFAMLRVPRSAKIGRVVGVAYLTLTVHVPPEASGVVNEQVVPGMLYSAPTWLRVSAVTCTGPPLAVTVTTLVTAARGVGMVNVRVRTPRTVPRVPFVADVKVRVPGAIPVPVRRYRRPRWVRVVGVADSQRPVVRSCCRRVERLR